MTTDSKSKLYTVSLLFRSLRDGKFLPTNLWEEVLLLVRADDEAQAISRATAIAMDRAIAYEVSGGERLEWQFFQVMRAYELDSNELTDGCELFSRHLRHSEVQSLLTPFDDESAEQ